MANQKQLQILMKSVEDWNDWRERHLNIHVDLRGADLREVDFHEDGLVRTEAGLEDDWIIANLSGVDLREAELQNTDLAVVDLRKANLSDANLEGANLREANLRGAILSRPILYGADLIETNLTGANLDGAKLQAANLSGAYLDKASLCGAQLYETNLTEASVVGCNFSRAEVNRTIFASSGLSQAMGLENLIHHGPSIISSYAYSQAKGNIPEAFLQGCGLSDWEIEMVKLYNPDLSNYEFIDIQNRIFELRSRQAIQISPLFISYSHGDSTFVDKLESQLNERGIRFWRDIHDLKAGRIEKQIDRAISQNRIVLLILSNNSLKSDWVEHEVRTARSLEKDMGRDVLCPVALDDGWKDSRWPKRVMEQIMEYNILDFSAWQDDSKFDSMFRKLIDGLELFYKG